MFPVPTEVNPEGVVFQLVGAETLDGMHPNVTCPKYRVAAAVWGWGPEVVWFTCAEFVLEGAPTLTSGQVPRSVAPLYRWSITQELMVPVQPDAEPAFPLA